MQPTTFITGDDVPRVGESTALYVRIAMESDQGTAGLQVPHLRTASSAWKATDRFKERREI